MEKILKTLKTIASRLAEARAERKRTAAFLAAWEHASRNGAIDVTNLRARHGLA
jgi:hypothetical protein